MLSQVRKGIRAGTSVDDLARDIDLSRHGIFGADKQANATSIRAVYRFLKAKGSGSGQIATQFTHCPTIISAAGPRNIATPH